MSISKPFILRPIATSLLMVIFLLTGILTYSFLPISALPEIDYPSIQVKTFYPGASPKVIATSITSPLERQFGQMPGLNQMSSISSNGLSLITLQFSLNLNIDVAEQEVQAAINSASGFLPNGLPNPPIYSKINPADPPIMTLALTSDTLNLSKVEDLAETRLIQKISQIGGVGLVSVSGGQRPAIRIKANTDQLASYRLSTTDIRNAVASSNINAAKGNFDGKDLAYTINANDQLLSIEDYRNLIISYSNNLPVRLSDVAKVIEDVENINQAAWFNKKPAIIVNIQRQPGANVIKVADNIKKLLSNLTETLPAGVELAIVSDRTKTIRASIDDVKFELILAIILVIIVIFCFLRDFSVTIIPSITVPLSLVSTFTIMYLMGFSLNNLTLMALTIATGFVVDDAIVMVENIMRYIEMGEKPLQASLKGASQIGFTIISLTISLIAVLIPLFFMEDIIGRLFREFAITLAVSILISGFISLSLTPMLCSKILKTPNSDNKSKFTEFLKKSLDSLTDKYRNSLIIILNHQKLTLLVILLTLISTGLLFCIVPKGFFPIQDNGMIQAISVVREDTSFNNMAIQQKKIADIILSDPNVESISSFIGIDETNISLNNGKMLINLKSTDGKKVDSNKVIERIKANAKILESVDLFLQPVQDLSISDKISNSQYQYSLSSYDSDAIAHYSNLLYLKLKNDKLVKDVSSDQQNNAWEIFVEIDRTKSTIFGVTTQNIVDALYDVFGQRQISTIYGERNQYHVILEGNSKIEKSIKNLDDIYIKGAEGAIILLKNLVKISQRQTRSLIFRQNQFSVATISFNLADSVSLGEGVDIVENAKDSLNMPIHIDAGFQGTALAFTNSTNNEIWLIIAAIIVIYIVLGVLYESYIHPITILSTLPSACIGALLALILYHKDLDVISIIGLILLIGIVKKNAIMIIDVALEQERTMNKSSFEAIFEACVLRFRPILMTTMAAFFGAIPLVIGNGIGSEIRSPLGITIMGGLIVSQLLTLYTTPVIYLAFDKISKSFNKRVSK